MLFSFNCLNIRLELDEFQWVKMARTTYKNRLAYITNYFTFEILGKDS